MKKWFVAINGEQVGPLTAEEALTRITEAKLGPQTLVWCEGMKDWIPLAHSELFTVSAPATPPRHLRLVPNVPAAVGEAVPYGGFWIRFLAWFIDHVILLGVSVMIGFAIGIVLGLKGMGSAQVKEVMDTVGIFISFGTNFFYLALIQPVLGGSLGKLICGLRLVRDDFTPVSIAQGVGRYFATIVSSLPLGFGFVAISFSPRKQGWHDLLAKTVVVDKRYLAQRENPAPVVGSSTEETTRKAA